MLIQEWLRRVGMLLRREQFDRDLDAEMRLHVELREQRGREQGMSDDAAHRAARRQFGNATVLRERSRDAWGWTWLEQSAQDIRYGLRMMARTPGFTAVAVLSLALGIGANTAIFTVLDAVMLKRLPVTRPAELVKIGHYRPGRKFADGFTYNLWQQARKTDGVFAGMLAYGAARFDLAKGGEKQPVSGLWVSGDYFSTLGVRPLIGRTLTESDDQRGAAPAAVISYGFWQRQYAGDPNIAGRDIRLDGHVFQIVGVTPPRFFGMEVGRQFDVAVPIQSERIFHPNDPWLDGQWTWWLSIAGRLKPGMDAQQAKARLEAASHAIYGAAFVTRDAEEKEWVDDQELTALPADTGYSDVRDQYGLALELLMGMVGLVLLIACANVANLLLARSSARRREMAVRLALGAGRMRLIRQVLTESLMLAALGSVLGLALASWGSELLVRAISSRQQPYLLDLSLDLRVLGFTAGLTGLTGILFGLMPALRSAGMAPYVALKDGGRALGERQGRWGAGRVLVSAQVAMSLFLLIGAGLFVRSLEKLLTQDPGFLREGVLLVRADLRATGNAAAANDAAHSALMTRLRSLPGVRSVGRSEETPTDGGTTQWDVMVQAPGVPLRRMHVYANRVSPGFFQAMGTPLLAGRDVTDRDTKAAPQVALINETAARQFFPGLNPLGQTMSEQNWAGNKEWYPVQVVGVVKDARYRTLSEDIPPTVYRPIAQMPMHGEEATYELRFEGPLADVTARVKQATNEVDPRIGLAFSLFSTQVEESLLSDRLLALLASFFGGLALLLAGIGIYGLMSYTTARRTNEIGIRMALGARAGDVVGMVVDEAAVLIVAGVGVGIPAALLATRLLESMLFGIRASDPVTFVSATLLMGLAGIVAVLVPARRAAQVDPMVALRHE